MEIIVGVTHEEQTSGDALALGIALARTFGAGIVITNIYPAAYGFPSAGNVDAEWRQFLGEQANAVLDRYEGAIPSDIPVKRKIHGHKSSGTGLAEVAADRSAVMIAIGSSPGGSEGRISTGSTADQLLHGSPVAVALAPRGYRGWSPAAVERTAVAFQGTGESKHALAVAIESFQRANLSPAVAFHLFTVIERVTRIYGSQIGRGAEAQVLDALREQAAETLTKACKLTSAAGIAATTSVVEGDSVFSAMTKAQWRDGDVIVTGSSSAGLIKRVFIADGSYKIIRSSAVPVIVIPQGAELPVG